MPSLIAISMLAIALSIRGPMQAPDGKAVFDTHCKKCHGATGKPSAAMKKLLPELPVWDAAFFAQRSDSQIVQVINDGKGRNMKPLQGVVKPEEMLAVARYIRTLTP